MASDVKPPAAARRPLPLRADEARQTRRRVLESARRLFVDRGYAATTVAAVADAAGASPETIYLSLGGKRGLLEGVIDITGPDGSATDDDKWWGMVARCPPASDRLEELVEFSCRILARTRPIHAIIRGAADKEAFVAAHGRRLLWSGSPPDHANPPLPRRRAPDRDYRSPRPGERFCALASPELYHLLTVDLAWRAEEHRQWLTRLLQTELLGTRGRRSVRPR